MLVVSLQYNAPTKRCRDQGRPVSRVTPGLLMPPLLLLLLREILFLPFRQILVLPFREILFLPFRDLLLILANTNLALPLVVILLILLLGGFYQICPLNIRVWMGEVNTC